MRKDGKGFSATLWSAVALGAVGIGVLVAFLAGYFLGHFTGHEDTTTVGAITSPAVEAEEEAEAPAEEHGEEGEAEARAGEEARGREEAKGREEEGEEGEEKAKGGEEATTTAGNPEAGAEVFAANCSACHGATGHGGAAGPDLRTMPKAKTEAGTIEQVTNGGSGMPPFGGTLSEEEIKDVAAYVVQDVVGSG
jgi:mono/diheme cytochrome c family protein